MSSSFAGLIGLLACGLPFILIQRWLHREIQAVFLLLTRRQTLAVGLFSLLFLPGVLLHEASHFLAAVLLRVPTGRVSLIPQMLPDGRLRLGFVEVSATDPVRDALIGTAPLISGGIAIALLGNYPLGLSPITPLAFQGRWNELGLALLQLPTRKDFFVWFYLAFTISSTMLPSPSDRRAWLPISFGLVGITGVAVLAGAGPWLLENVAPWINRGLESVALVFAISLGLHLLLAVPVGLLRALLSRLTGLTVGP
jgi:hypothetical protein